MRWFAVVVLTGTVVSRNLVDGFCVSRRNVGQGISRRQPTWELTTSFPMEDVVDEDDVPIGARWVDPVKTACGSFGYGVTDVGLRYWSHTARQSGVGFIAFCLSFWWTGCSWSQPALQLMETIAQNRWIYSFLCTVDRCITWAASCCRGWPLSRPLIGAPVAEELIYRLFLLQVLRHFLRKRGTSTKHRYWTSWSVITSFVFAITHVNLGMMMYAQRLSMHSVKGRLLIANDMKKVAEVFFGAIFHLNPMMEKRGLFAAIGTHFAWNATVFVPHFSSALVHMHWIHRTLAEYTLAWTTVPLQKAADTLLHTRMYLTMATPCLRTMLASHILKRHGAPTPGV